MRMYSNKAVCSHVIGMRNIATFKKEVAAQILKIDERRLNPAC